MTMEDVYSSAKQKALKINLDPSIYGTFAEIGAGQEVARIFFQAGGASGTVAKTMSAYDMVFSDAIYGKEPSGRYVCESRLKKMLEHEYQLILLRLGHLRSQQTCFFAFANTVAALNFQGNNESHGWVGIRFQHCPQAAASEVLIHVRMLDRKNILQQEALGIVGVNLIYGAFYMENKNQDFIRSLMDGLGRERIEIDAVKVSGPAFQGLDPRLLCLQLIKLEMAHAIIFDAQGVALQPSEVLYKKNVLALRSSFRPPTLLNMDMIRAGLEQFKEEKEVKEEETVILCEMTLKNLREGGELDEKDFLDRVDLLGALGYKVLVSNYHEYFRLSSYFSQFTKKKMGIILSVYNLEEIFDAQNYQYLQGGILEALGIIFSRPVRLYVYPATSLGGREGNILDCHNFRLEKSLHHLFDYFYENGLIQDLVNFDPTALPIYSRTVLEMIQKGEPGWEQFVPPIVAKKVKEFCLFGHPCPPQQKAMALAKGELYKNLEIDPRSVKKKKQALSKQKRP